MITDLLTKELFIESLEATEKADAIEAMIDCLEASGKLNNRSKYAEAVFHREAEFSTGIGMGVAIPHGKSDGVKTPSLVFARSQKGVEFESMDDAPAYLLFLVAVPEAGGDEHLRILGMLSRKLMHQAVRDALMQAKSYEDVIRILEES
ncbi:PTS sugar transporter subunit IIA [Fusibacter paucivorans]|uniref:PTS sugar transporter subunit IIA n=1 Tax=Fusibacter paucivorans TaxID=76009 RepID=A0ABS5PJX9_9FIRM|nr:PTS sugar transporter subunit IIA [Fusibacter paucivorans]MBS7525455.1 PTS sugar transporter subunit IIA [Fusibacter paucivorans]